MLLIPGLPVFSIYQLYLQIKDMKTLAASIGSTNEMLNQSCSNDFDSSEAPTFLGCFKLPVPPAVRRNPQVPASTTHKVLGPGIDGRGIPRGPRAIRMETGIS